MIRTAQLSVLAAAIGSAVFSIPVAGVQLSSFRALLGLLAVLAIADSLYRGKNNVRRDKYFYYPHWFMLAWLAVAIASVLWAQDFVAWLRGTFFILVAAATIFLYTVAFRRADHIYRAVSLMAAMAVIHNIVGWYEVVSGNLLFLQNSSEFYEDNGLAASTFANTNNFATYLTVSLGPLAIVAFVSKTKILHIGMLAAILSSVGLVLNSGSRANILALLVWGGAFAVMTFIQRKKPVLAGLVVAILAGVYFLTLGTGVQERSTQDDLLAFNFEGGRNSETVRINLIRNAVEFVGDTYGAGTGAGNVEYWMENFARYPTWGVWNVHNWWIEILATYGVVIFVGYLVLVLWLVLHLVRLARFSHDMAVASGAKMFICSVAAFAVGSASASSNVSSEWLWVFFSVAIAYVCLHGREALGKYREPLGNVGEQS